MEEMERTVIETQARCKSNQRRIDDLEKKSEAIQSLALSVRDLANSTRTISEELAKQGERLTLLEQEPANRWNSMARTLVTTAVSTMTGGIVGMLVSFLLQ